MLIFGWLFHHGEHREVRIMRGKRGRYRWGAYINGIFEAEGRIRGHETSDQARAAAGRVLGSGWKVASRIYAKMRRTSEAEAAPYPPMTGSIPEPPLPPTKPGG